MRRDRRSPSSRLRLSTGGEGDRHDELFRRYLEEIQAHPPLTVEEESRLGRLARNGDTEAGELLIRGSLQLVVTIARRYQSSGLPLLDLVQEGNLGLVQAVESFDPERGFAFRTVAHWWIRQGIAAAIEEHGAPTLPVVDPAADLQDVWDGFVAHEGRQPTVAELASMLSLDESRVLDLLGPPPPPPDPPGAGGA
ncbi:MAG: sigma-70 family RNA polymerase sigma factor, partial [Actinomycetota bacterium]|nr:sigma-70 family RNA polymerase sigma factor [Actinomycetota bacterium]